MSRLGPQNTTRYVFATTYMLELPRGVEDKINPDRLIKRLQDASPYVDQVHVEKALGPRVFITMMHHETEEETWMDLLHLLSDYVGEFDPA